MKEKVYYITEERVEQITYAVTAESKSQADEKFWAYPPDAGHPFTECEVADQRIIGSTVYPSEESKFNLIGGKEINAKNI